MLNDTASWFLCLILINSEYVRYPVGLSGERVLFYDLQP
jgi:hypothetical protein